MISSQQLKEVEANLQENHNVLKNLLHGIFLVREATRRTMDYVLSFGERNSCFIIANALKEQGINAEYLDARKIMKTDSTFGGAKVNFQHTFNCISKYYNEQPVVQIVTGFIGTNETGRTPPLWEEEDQMIPLQF